MKNTLLKIKVLLIAFFYVLTNFVYAFGIEGLHTEETSGNNKIIYLTFDDGPSCNTDKVLDVLKKYDVKATFFLIGNQINGQENTVRRIQEEGHSIGVHTYTHKFNKVHAGNMEFISEMTKCQEEIYRVTGVKASIIRFPGGSRKRLNKQLKIGLEEMGFKIYDWNIDSRDGVNPKMPVEKLFRQATDTDIDNKSEPIMLLMHCDYMHNNTYKTLPYIIKFYKDKGYEFKVIDDNTPEYYFPIKK